MERYLLDPRAEGAFYIRFCAMPPMHRQVLAQWWGIDDEWRLFKRICGFFRV